MRKLASLTAAAALVAVFGFAGTASADEFADAVAVSAITNCGGSCDATQALGAPNGTWVSLGDDGNIVLNFTDNVCLDDGTGTVDFTVTELFSAETYSVSIGQQGLALTALTAGGTGTTSFDTEGVAAFNQILITDDGDMLFANGSDIDAVTCLFSFDLGTAQIEKDFASGSAEEIIIQAKNATSNGQQVFSFEIEIWNDEGQDLTDIVFEDVLPAEFDLDGDAEDTADGGFDGNCPTDGVCDGVMVTDNAADCTATGAEHTNSGKSNKPFKRQPDIITITADTLGAGEHCEITVWAMTDQKKAFGSGKVIWTPTECNEDTFIFLNDGVQVIDTSGAEDVVLFRDDDQLELSCVAPTFE